MLFNRSPNPKIHNIKRAALCAVMTVLVLVVFQPFGTYESDLTFKYLRLCGYGVVTFLALYLCGRIDLAISKIDKNTLGYKAGITVLTLILVAAFNHGYFSLAVLGQWHWQNQLLFLYYVAAVAVIPAAIIYVRSAQPVTIEDAETTSTPITIIGENKSDELTVAIDNILTLQTADNYCEIRIIHNQTVTTHILRSPISNILAQIPEDKHIVRCHRSHAVNLSHVSKYVGNANGLTLTLDIDNISVPVSRRYVKSIKEALLLVPKSS